MSNQKQDPLVESLMQLAASAAPLIRRARESGMFRNDFGSKAESAETVDATVVKPAPAPETPADVAALQAILVRQALRISELESEVAALKAKQKATPKPKAAPKGKPAAGKRATK
jgi:hypothetical protein